MIIIFESIGININCCMMLVLLIFAIPIICKVKPNILLNYGTPKLIQGNKSTIISDSRYLLDYKNISGRMFFLSSHQLDERIQDERYNSFLHISIMNLTFTLSIINKFYLQTFSIFGTTSVDFCNAKLVDSTKFRVIMAFC